MSSTSSQVSSGTETGADGSITVVGGATVSGLTINGVTEYVLGSAVDTVVHGYEILQYNPDPYIPPTTGTQIVQSGGVASHTQILSELFYQEGNLQSEVAPASQIVQNGGSAFDTTVQGAAENSYIGVGIYYDQELEAYQTVESGGYVSGVQVKNDALSTIAAGGSATNTVIQGSSGIFYLGNDDDWHYETLHFQAEQDVEGTSENVSIQSDGRLVVDGTVRDATVSNGGMMIAHSGAILSDISVSSGGVLEIDSGVSLQDPITVQTSAALIFTDVGIKGATISAVVVPDEGGATGSLEIFSGTTMVKDIAVQGDFTSPLYFTQAAAGNYLEMGFGTPCYCPGTLIATPDGERPVEDLEIGDPVLTANGQIRPVHWIGRRAYDPLFAYGNRDVLPILIRAGALTNGLPRRDLMISPLHAMFIDGFLVPALHLVNGTSIIQIERPETIRYIHIELESHDLLLAEGAPSESFLDDGSRGMFHNAEEYRTLYPDAPDQTPRYCAPRIEGGDELEAIHRRLCSSAPAHDDRPPTGAAA
ncbi:Hint domain-containing protein [Gluconobacter sphaericus]|uniref:Hint domain-containing protein n=1 Tax=Gluconobacter sphaericus TaxID=574987 RepID=UPI001B8B5324|nr:Hint domain-containing protein [Gluconobacter sphaericus]MBS1086810.1 Hint domain-containing protein [Gluconobacter sphaericus]MBS1100685.1 Hint domain-containing protein [Gluconobacter sphaericus]